MLCYKYFLIPTFFCFQGNILLNEKPHQCQPDFDRNKVTKLMQKIKREITSADVPSIPATYDKNVASLHLESSNSNIVSKIPPFCKVKSALYKYRNKNANVKKIYYNTLSEIEVPEKFHSFLLAKYIDEDISILIFCSEHAKNLMKTCKHLFGDGTFKSCPQPFIQLYSLHADLGSSQQTTNIVPLVYALMSTKSTKAYTALFSVIKSQIPDWQPHSFQSDFEAAAMTGFKNVFKSASIKGCFFHFCKAIWKKGKGLGLTKSKYLRKQVALSAVLPLLPEEKIFEGWFYIAAQSPDDEKSKEFRKYMLRNWLKDNFLKVWCVFGAKHRTTNALESWHNKLNKKILKKSPSLLRLLNVLYEDITLSIVKSMQNQPSKLRLDKYIQNDQNIQDAQMELINGDITVGHFLEKLR